MTRWTVETIEAAERGLLALPADLQASFIHVAEMLEEAGPHQVGMPLVRPLEAKLWEMWREMKTLKTLKAELLADPEVRRTCDAESDAFRAPEYEIARAIIRARTASGMTQAQLAERMGTSQSFIARLEAGRTMPSTRTLLKIAAATGTRPRFTLEAA